jgi:hypothetical protein
MSKELSPMKETKTGMKVEEKEVPYQIEEGQILIKAYMKPKSKLQEYKESHESSL